MGGLRPWNCWNGYCSTESSACLLIGSVREDEVNSGHPLSIAIQEIERANVIPLKHIQLDELSAYDISLLLAERFNTKRVNLNS